MSDQFSAFALTPSGVKRSVKKFALTRKEPVVSQSSVIFGTKSQYFYQGKAGSGAGQPDQAVLSLCIPRELDWMTLKGPFQLQVFLNSMILSLSYN